MERTETFDPAASRDATSAVRRLWQRARKAPAYPAVPADLRTFSLAGLALPLRATTAIAVVTLAVLFDFSQALLQPGTLATGGHLAHVSKPPLELFSTLGGGLAYGWLAWRTASVAWGSLAHVYILTLVTVAAADTM